VPVSANLDKILDKEYETKTLSEILAASPAALAGVTDADAVHLQEAFGIKTVADFGSNKYFRAAAALAALKDLGGA
jgi:hypothetical protein